MIGDLHTHTRLSDGALGIDDLIYYAKRAGLDFISVTDHDTMDGVSRAQLLGRRYGLSVIPGVEISCMDSARGEKAWILCYFPDKAEKIQGLLTKTLEARVTAGKQMLKAVMRYYPITEGHVMRYASGSKAVYQGHILQALLDVGYDGTVFGALQQQLFDPDKGTCFHETDYYPDVYQVLEAVHNAGGVAVLAHPTWGDTGYLLRELAEKELIHGVEAWNPDAKQPMIEKIILPMAKSYGLIVTGGSDFHGQLCKNPRPLASCATNEENLHLLFALKNKN